MSGGAPVDGRELVIGGGHAWSVRRWPGLSQGAGAPTLVALHGFTGTGDDFEPLIFGMGSGMGRLACPWITLDILGHGRSDAPPSDAAAYAMRSVANALAQVIAEAVRSPYVLLGYSMGGRLALTALLEQLDVALARPAGLVLIGATPGLRGPEERARRREEDIALARAIETRGIAWFREEWGRRPILAGKRRIAPEARAAMEERLCGQRPRGLAGSLRGMGTGAMRPLWDDLERLDLPTLLISGAEDLKFTAIAEQIHELVPRSTVRVLDGVGHSAHLEDPLAWLAVVEPWLAGLAGLELL